MRAAAPGAASIVFIAGTDTGVGKTLLTGLLLEALRSTEVKALGVKPFSSGSGSDARILQRLQSGVLSVDEVSPYRYALPVAPALAAEMEGVRVSLPSAIAYLGRMRKRCGCLLVEGCGGLLSPLGAGFDMLEIIRRLGGHVIVVARNRLGAINHVLLTVRALESAHIKSLQVVLMNDRKRKDLAARSNPPALAERLACGVWQLPFLGGNACSVRQIRGSQKFLQKTLARMLPSVTVTAL